jgi:hypothetical protein
VGTRLLRETLAGVGFRVRKPFWMETCFSFPEHCGGQRQQQEPRRLARLELWNENIQLLLLLSGVVAVWALCSGLACHSCGSSWPMWVQLRAG